MISDEGLNKLVLWVSGNIAQIGSPEGLAKEVHNADANNSTQKVGGSAVRLFDHETRISVQNILDEIIHSGTR